MIGASVLSAVLLVLCIVLDQADEDSTLGTLADWSWVAFIVSLVLLLAVSIWALAGRLRTARS